MAKFCPECGSPIDDPDSQFCPKCGARLPIPSPREQPPIVQQNSVQPPAQSLDKKSDFITNFGKPGIELCNYIESKMTEEDKKILSSVFFALLVIGFYLYIHFVMGLTLMQFIRGI